MIEKMIYELMLIILGVALGLVSAIFVTLIMYGLRSIIILPMVRDEMVKACVENGHVVEAKMLPSTDLYESPDAKSGIFAYKYNGVKYKYASWNSHKLPDEIVLYFQENPRRACRYEELGTKEHPYFITCYWAIAVLTIAAAYFVIKSVFKF